MIAIDLLLKIFVQNSYTISNFTIKNFRCFFASSENGSDFYLIIDKEFYEDEDIFYIRTKGVLELFSKIKTLEAYRPGVDKNTILVVCIDERVKLFEEMIRIEEDAFTFKKNILMYSNTAIAELVKILGADFSKTNLSLQLFQPEQFDSIKNKNNLDYYKLLVNIFIKLPMLTLDGNRIKKLQNIKEKIESRISKDGLATLLDATQKVNWESVETYEDIAELCFLLTEG